MVNTIIGTINMGKESEEDETKLAKLIDEIIALLDQYEEVNAMQGRKHPMSEAEVAEAVSSELAKARDADTIARAHSQLDAEAGKQLTRRDAALKAEKAGADRAASVAALEKAMLDADEALHEKRDEKRDK